MTAHEINSINRKLDELSGEMKENTKLTQEALDKFGSRVSELELAEARRQGRESSPKSSDVGSAKVIISLIGLVSLALTIIASIVTGVIK